jgi:16S rRNA G527 N7-methylase RsmG
MSRSINELLAKEMLIHPPTSEAEVQRQYIVLMGKFSTNHDLTSPSKVEEAIRSHLITDHALLEEWILVRQALDVISIHDPGGVPRDSPPPQA